MDKIQRCVDNLIELICEGETYQRYIHCEKKLHEHPELLKKIDEIRVAAYRLNNGENSGDMYAQIEQFEQKFHEYHRISLVNEFLEAELDVCKMLQQIGTNIQGGVAIRIPKL